MYHGWIRARGAEVIATARECTTEGLGGLIQAAGGAVSRHSDRSSRAVLDRRRQAPLFPIQPHRHAAILSLRACTHLSIQP